MLDASYSDSALTSSCLELCARAAAGIASSETKRMNALFMVRVECSLRLLAPWNGDGRDDDRLTRLGHVDRLRNGLAASRGLEPHVVSPERHPNLLEVRADVFFVDKNLGVVRNDPEPDLIRIPCWRRLGIRSVSGVARRRLRLLDRGRGARGSGRNRLHGQGDGVCFTVARNHDAREQGLVVRRPLRLGRVTARVEGHCLTVLVELVLDDHLGRIGGETRDHNAPRLRGGGGGYILLLLELLLPHHVPAKAADQHDRRQGWHHHLVLLFLPLAPPYPGRRGPPPRSADRSRHDWRRRTRDRKGQRG